jgi:hypothetical protein
MAFAKRRFLASTSDLVEKMQRFGWDAHVGSASLHPEWETTISSSKERKLAFRERFLERLEE